MPSALSAVLLSVCFAPQESKKPNAPPLCGLATISVDSAFTILVADPGEAVRQFVRAFGDVDGEALDPGAIDAQTQATLDEFGVRLDDPASWAKAGVAPDQPVQLSLADPGGFLGLPRTAWLTFGIADEPLLRRMLQALNGASEDVGGTPAIATDTADRVAWCRVGGRMIVLTRTGDGAADELAEIAARTAATASIGSDPLYHEVAAICGRTAFAVLWFEGARMYETDRPDRAWLLALTDETIELGVAPGAASEWFDTLHPGGEARRHLARLPRPMASASASLAEPLRALEVLRSGGDFGQLAEEVLSMFVDVLGGAEAEQQLRNVGIGIAVYPGAAPFGEPRFVVCLTCPDAAAVVRRIEAHPQIAERVRRDGARLSLQIDEREVSIAAMGDDCLLIGDAHEELLTSLASEDPIWQPVVGGKELMACELDFEAIAGWNGIEDPQALARFREYGHMVATAARGEAALLVHAEFRRRAATDQGAAPARLTLFQAICGLASASRLTR